MRGLKGYGFPEPTGTPGEQASILMRWDTRIYDTSKIAKAFNRQKSYIERQLHHALDIRRSVKSSLGKQE